MSSIRSCGNSGFNYKATDNDTFRRLSYGRGVQEPSMFESGVGETPLLAYRLKLSETRN